MVLVEHSESVFQHLGGIRITGEGVAEEFHQFQPVAAYVNRFWWIRRM